MTTLRQIESNRRNAQLSCGPKTDAGKLQSCRNALKHGLAGRGLVLPDAMADEARRRNQEWNGSLKPIDAFETKLAEMVAVESVRIDQLDVEDRELLAQHRDRAVALWDDERGLEAEELGRRIARDPAIVRLRLRRGPHGCAWLIERLEGLAAILEAGMGWDARQLALAHDCLGTPTELRSGPNRLGRGAEPSQVDRDAALAVLRAEIERLEGLRSGALSDLDARRREAAELGIGLEPTPERALVRRYLAAAHRRLSWLLGQFAGRNRRPAAAPRPAPSPASARPAAPPPAAPPPPPRVEAPPAERRTVGPVPRPFDDLDSLLGGPSFDRVPICIGRRPR